MGTLYLIGIAFGLFFAVLLYNKPVRGAPDTILMGWFLVIVLHLFGAHLHYTGLHLEYPHLIGTTDGFAFLYGPFLYFYVRSLVEEPPHFASRDLLHALPLAGYTLIYLPFFMSPATQKAELYAAGITAVPGVLTVGIAVKLASLPFYLVLTGRLLRRHASRAEQYTADADAIQLRWIRCVLVGVGLFWLSIVGLHLLQDVLGVVLPVRADPLIFCCLVVGMVAFGVLGFRQGTVFASTAEIAHSQAAVDSAPRYERSGLQSAAAADVADRLLAWMDEEKPYLDSGLTVEEVAQGVGVSRHTVTQVLNEHLGKNFYLFVNEYRVAEACRRIVDPASNPLTLLAIGLESGFSSKSSFNAAFKRLTSLTPSQYRLEHAPDPDTADSGASGA